jgi:integrase
MAESTKKRFTEQMIDRLGAPKSGRLEIADELCPGLVLRVTDRGVKSLSVIFRIAGEGGLSELGRPLAGKQHRVTLGRWPIVGLVDARERAREILRQAGQGTDARRVLAEALASRQDNTFAAVFERHIRQDASRTISSWRNIERVLRLHVMPTLGSLPVEDIRRADIHRLLDDLVADGRVGTAREVRKHLSRVFNWAADREIIASNPIYALKRSDLATASEAGRALSDEELRAIWRAADEMRYPFGMLFQLLILTGQRRAEWAESKRSELSAELDALELSRERFKGRRSHIVPIVGAASGIVQRLPAWADRDDYYLFSSRTGHVAVAGFSQAKTKLDRLAANYMGTPIKPYRVHDFRVTCETRLAHLGFNQDVRDAVLGHAKPGLQKTYNKYDYLHEKRRALEAYGAHILELVDANRGFDPAGQAVVERV